MGISNNFREIRAILKHLRNWRKNRNIRAATMNFMNEVLHLMYFYFLLEFLHL